MGVAAEVEVEVVEEEGVEAASWRVELSGVGSRAAEVVAFVEAGERGVLLAGVVGRGVGVWSLLLLSDRAVPLLGVEISCAPR